VVQTCKRSRVGVKLHLQALLISVLDGCVWSALRHGCYNCGVIASVKILHSWT
jgi:hypothetical protein